MKTKTLIAYTPEKIDKQANAFNAIEGITVKFTQTHHTCYDGRDVFVFVLFYTEKDEGMVSEK